MNRNLDELLSRPLAEIPDREFSARVMAGIARRNIRRARIEAVSWIAFALVTIAALASTAPGRELAAAALSLGIFAQIGVALTALLLLFAFKDVPE